MIRIFVCFIERSQALIVKHCTFDKIFYSKSYIFFSSKALDLEIEPLKIRVGVGIGPHIQLILQIFTFDDQFQITTLKICLEGDLMLLEAYLTVEAIEHYILLIFGDEGQGVLLSQFIVDGQILIDLLKAFLGFGLGIEIAFHFMLDGEGAIVKVY